MFQRRECRLLEKWWHKTIVDSKRFKFLLVLHGRDRGMVENGGRLVGELDSYSFTISTKLDVLKGERAMKSHW